MNNIKGTIETDELRVGRGVVVEEGVFIRAKRVVLGDHAYIGQNTRVIVPEFTLGEYSRFNADSFAGGTKPLQIGRHCYIGAKVRLDSRGGLDIDDGVGIGDHSQLWTHIRHGDTVEGCRYDNEKYMYIGRDAWLVGHCLVSPVRIHDKAMALLGSVISRDMMPNRTYAGVPAVDVTAKVGAPYETLTTEEKLIRLRKVISKFEDEYPQHKGFLRAWSMVTDLDLIDPSITYFDVSKRTYTKTNSAAEVAFFKSTLVKFAPAGEGAWVIPQHPALTIVEAVV